MQHRIVMREAAGGGSRPQSKEGIHVIYRTVLRLPHYDDQLKLYEDFACRPQAFYSEDVEKAAVTRQTLVVK